MAGLVREQAPTRVVGAGGVPRLVGACLRTATDHSPLRLDGQNVALEAVEDAFGGVADEQFRQGTA